MNRRNFITQASLSFGAIAFARHGFLSPLFPEPWKITMLRGNAGIFEEKGGTILFLLSNAGIVVVDSQFPEQSVHLKDELIKRNNAPFKYLINTHHHGDHSGGNISFKGVAEHIVAHANSKLNQENSAKQNKSEAKQLYPDLTFTRTWKKKIGQEKIKLHYFGPGHTNGDSFVHFEEANIVHCGDLVFNRRHPFVDRTTGANIESWIDVLGKALKEFDTDTQYVFGHSANGYKVTGTTEDIKAFRDYLGNLLKFAGEGIKSGKTKEEILKATIIPGAEEWMTEGIQRPLGAAVDELLAK